MILYKINHLVNYFFLLLSLFMAQAYFINPKFLFL